MRKLKICSVATTSAQSGGSAARKFLDWCKKRNFPLNGNGNEKPYVIVECPNVAILGFISQLCQKFDCSVIVSTKNLKDGVDAELCLYDDYID